jgi:hypothetical protein
MRTDSKNRRKLSEDSGEEIFVRNCRKSRKNILLVEENDGEVEKAEVEQKKVKKEKEIVKRRDEKAWYKEIGSEMKCIDNSMKGKIAQLLGAKY